MCHSWPLFLDVRLSVQLTVNNFQNINFADDWIQTADLWYQKQQIYQLSHNHCPTCFTVLIGFLLAFFKENFKVKSVDLPKRDLNLDCLGETASTMNHKDCEFESRCQKRWNKEEHLEIGDQCNQMAGLFFKYSAIYSTEKLPNIIKFTKVAKSYHVTLNRSVRGQKEYFFQIRVRLLGMLNNKNLQFI